MEVKVTILIIITFLFSYNVWIKPIYMQKKKLLQSLGNKSFGLVEITGGWVPASSTVCCWVFMQNTKTNYMNLILKSNPSTMTAPKAKDSQNNTSWHRRWRSCLANLLHTICEPETETDTALTTTMNRNYGEVENGEHPSLTTVCSFFFIICFVIYLFWFKEMMRKGDTKYSIEQVLICIVSVRDKE